VIEPELRRNRHIFVILEVTRIVAGVDALIQKMASSSTSLFEGDTANADVHHSCRCISSNKGRIRVQ
jgi:hypothetical protein